MRVLNYKGMDIVLAISIGIIIVFLIYGYKIHCNEREKFNVGGQWDTTGSLPPSQTPTQTPSPSPQPSSPSPPTNQCSKSIYSKRQIPQKYHDRLNYESCAKYKVVDLDDGGYLPVNMRDYDRAYTPSASKTKYGDTGIMGLSNCPPPEWSEFVTCYEQNIVNTSGLEDYRNLYGSDCKPINPTNKDTGDITNADFCKTLGRKSCNNASINGSYLCYFNDSQNPNIINSLSESEKKNYTDLRSGISQICGTSSKTNNKYICISDQMDIDKVIAEKCKTPGSKIFSNKPWERPNQTCFQDHNNIINPNNTVNIDNLRTALPSIIGSPNLNCTNVCGKTVTKRRRLINKQDDDSPIKRSISDRNTLLFNWVKEYIQKIENIKVNFMDSSVRNDNMEYLKLSINNNIPYLNDTPQNKDIRWKSQLDKISIYNGLDDGVKIIEQIKGIANTHIYNINYDTNISHIQSHQAFMLHAHLYRLLISNGITSECASDMNDIVKIKARDNTNIITRDIYIINNPKQSSMLSNPPANYTNVYLNRDKHKPGYIRFKKQQNNNYKIKLNIDAQFYLQDSISLQINTSSDFNKQWLINNIFNKSTNTSFKFNDLSPSDLKALSNGDLVSNGDYIANNGLSNNIFKPFSTNRLPSSNNINYTYYYICYVLILYMDDIELSENEIMNARSLEQILILLYSKVLNDLHNGPLRPNIKNNINKTKENILNILSSNDTELFRIYLIYLINYSDSELNSNNKRFYNNAVDYIRINGILMGDYLRILQKMNVQQYIYCHINQNKLETINPSSSKPVETSFPFNIYYILYPKNPADSLRNMQLIFFDINDTILQRNPAINPYTRLERGSRESVLNEVGRVLNSFYLKVYHGYTDEAVDAPINVVNSGSNRITKITEQYMVQTSGAPRAGGFDYVYIPNDVGFDYNLILKLGFSPIYDLIEKWSRSNYDCQILIKILNELNIINKFDLDPSTPTTSPTPSPSPSLPRPTRDPDTIPNTFSKVINKLTTCIRNQNINERRNDTSYRNDLLSYIKSLLIKNPYLMDSLVYLQTTGTGDDLDYLLVINVTTDLYETGMADLVENQRLPGKDAECNTNNMRITSAKNAIKYINKTPNFETRMFVLTRPFAGVTHVDKKHSLINIARKSRIRSNKKVINVLKCLNAYDDRDSRSHCTHVANDFQGQFCLKDSDINCGLFRDNDTFPIGPDKEWDPSNINTIIPYNTHNTDEELSTFVISNCTRPRPIKTKCQKIGEKWQRARGVAGPPFDLKIVGTNNPSDHPNPARPKQWWDRTNPGGRNICGTYPGSTQYRACGKGWSGKYGSESTFCPVNFCYLDQSNPKYFLSQLCINPTHYNDDGTPVMSDAELERLRQQYITTAERRDGDL